MPCKIKIFVGNTKDHTNPQILLDVVTSSPTRHNVLQHLSVVYSKTTAVIQVSAKIIFKKTHYNKTQ